MIAPVCRSCGASSGWKVKGQIRRRDNSIRIAPLLLQSRHQTDSQRRFAAFINSCPTLLDKRQIGKGTMNDTLLALLSALAIYGLTSFAMPRGGWDNDDDATVQVEDSVDVPLSGENSRDTRPES